VVLFRRSVVDLTPADILVTGSKSFLGPGSSLSAPSYPTSIHGEGGASSRLTGDTPLFLPSLPPSIPFIHLYFHNYE
jgi:hypothetical protein